MAALRSLCLTKMEQAYVRPSPPKSLGPVTVGRRYAAVAGLCPAPRWGSAPDPAGAHAPDPKSATLAVTIIPVIRCIGVAAPGHNRRIDRTDGLRVCILLQKTDIRLLSLV